MFNNNFNIDFEKVFEGQEVTFVIHSLSPNGDGMYHRFEEAEEQIPANPEFRGPGHFSRWN